MPRTSTRLAVTLLLFTLAACDHDETLPPAATADAGADAAPTTPDGAGFVPDPACEYFDSASGEHVLACEGGWTTFSEMTSAQGDEVCPPWIAVDDQAFATFEEAVLAYGCDTTCVYEPRTAALFVYCDARAEAVTYRDDACPDLLHFESSAGGGWYPSWDAFEAEHPCP